MIRYALIEGLKTEPKQGLIGICPGCGHTLIAKCGNTNIHHWAHKNKQECDSWWEPITKWHIDWQNKFPTDWQEVVFTDEHTKEHHRADIYTPKGITIEFQNSLISDEEIKSRNNFYSKLIWVINALKFKDQFEFTQAIPDPNIPLLNNYEFAGDLTGFLKRMIFYRKDGIHISDSGSHSYRIFSLNAPELKEVAAFYKKEIPLNYLFIWKHKHKSWFSSTAPVFFDFGDDFLYLLKKKQQTYSRFWYVKKFTKTAFIAKYSSL